jgi:two-component system, OmpR family, sensor histidine kinase VicK
MKLHRKLSNPLLAFIGIQLVWILLVVFWVYWFLGRNREFRDLAQRYKPELVSHGLNWLVLVEGLMMLLLILAGVYVIFLYWRRQAALYQQQRSFISQLTHELKSPLASIQLHLETIKLRDLPREKLDIFLNTMLSDTGRLNNLISNLLMAARIEHRKLKVEAKLLDFTAFVRDYMDKKLGELPEGGRLTVETEDTLMANIDSEGMEMALRNLFENALLYSPASPDIRVSLKKSGRNALLTFQDNGKGLDKGDLDRIFGMFFRVRTPGENIRGTGLGLYIVKSVVNAHDGKISVTSKGVGTGCTFHITLPLADPPTEDR